MALLTFPSGKLRGKIFFCQPISVAELSNVVDFSSPSPIPMGKDDFGEELNSTQGKTAKVLSNRDPERRTPRAC